MADLRESINMEMECSFEGRLGLKDPAVLF
jgi:hypothetical protein